MQDGDVVTADH